MYRVQSVMITHSRRNFIFQIVVIFLLISILTLLWSGKAHAQGGNSNFPGGSGSGLPAGGLVGQTVVNTAAGAGTWQSGGVPLCNGGTVIISTPYTLLADSGTATKDRLSDCIVSTAGAGTFHILAGSTSGVGTNFTFALLNDGAGTWTIDNNAGSDTFNIGNGSTKTDAVSSFTVTTGQHFSITNSGISNGSGGVTWYVREVTGGGAPSGASQIQWDNSGSFAGVTGSTVSATGAVALAPTDTGNPSLKVTCPVSMSVDCFSAADSTGKFFWIDSGSTGRVGNGGSVCFSIFSAPFETLFGNCRLATSETALTSGTAAVTVWGQDQVTHTPSYNANNAGISSFTGAWNCVNVTPVTVNANSTSAQTLMACTVLAGTLNRVGRSLDIELAGVYTTPAAATPTFTVTVLLCSVSGCGSGNKATLLAITSTATLASVTNNAFNIMRAMCTTQTAGATLAMECHGILGIDLGSAVTSADSFFNDTNTATVTGSPSAIDSTAQNFLQVQVTFSTNQASADSATERQLVLQTVN